MFNHKYNASSVETEGPAPIPEGEYTVVVDQVTEKVSRKTGADMLEIKLKIVGAEPANQKFVNRTLNYYLLDDAYLDQKLYDMFTSCSKPIPAQVTGKEFLNLCGRIRTKLETYNGEQLASVRYWCRPKPGEAPVEPPKPKNSADDIPF